jgi:hypothetical protein
MALRVPRWQWLEQVSVAGWCPSRTIPARDGESSMQETSDGAEGHASFIMRKLLPHAWLACTEYHPRFCQFDILLARRSDVVFDTRYLLSADIIDSSLKASACDIPCR